MTKRILLLISLMGCMTMSYSQTNLALNKASYSTSNYGEHTPAMGNDGNINTAWASGGDDKYNYPKWWVDLETEYVIGKVVWVTRQDYESYDANRSGFVIEASNDSDFPEAATEILYTQAIGDPIPNGDSIQIDISTETAYRYVRARKTEQKHLIFGEIKIFEKEVGTGVNDQYQLGGCRLCPNPVKDMLNVVVDVNGNNKNAIMSIYSINGNVVIEKSHLLHSGINELRIGIETLNSGLYILQIKGDNMNIVQRFSKVD